MLDWHSPRYICTLSKSRYCLATTDICSGSEVAAIQTLGVFYATSVLIAGQGSPIATYIVGIRFQSDCDMLPPGVSLTVLRIRHHTFLSTDHLQTAKVFGTNQHVCTLQTLQQMLQSRINNGQ